MRKVLFTLMVIFVFNVAYAHKEKTHQYIVREAYNLLKKQYGSISVLENHIGYDEIGNGPWQTGLIVTGAYREDLEDLINHYSNNNPPKVTGVAANILFPLLPVFTDENAFVSITHFWDADAGDVSVSNLKGYVYISPTTLLWTLLIAPGSQYIVGNNPFQFSSNHNAYQKAMLFKNGGWNLGNVFNTPLQNQFSADDCKDDPECVGLIVEIDTIETINVTYSSIIELFKTGKMTETKFTTKTTYKYSRSRPYGPLNNLGSTVANTTTVTQKYLSIEMRQKYAYELLGRMCHLLGDMSVPAHTRK